MATARRHPTATLLPNGKVLIAGGLDGTTCYLASAELFSAASREPDLIVQSITTNPTSPNRDIQSFGESGSIPGKFSMFMFLSPGKGGQSLQDSSKLKQYIKSGPLLLRTAKEVR